MSAEFEKFRPILDTHYSQDDISLIERAFEFAESAHNGQARATGEPYFAHAAVVGAKLAELKLPSNVIAAGLLHDVP
jgi:GTP pyrophosphokinase